MKSSRAKCEKNGGRDTKYYEENKKNEFIQVILDWSIENLDKYPWRTHSTPYRVLLAEILLTRTTASAVKRIYNDFIRKYDSFQKILDQGEDELRKDMISIGHHNQRAKKLVEISSIISSEFDGKVPSSYDDLISIKHIGPYIAGAVLSLGHSKKASMVDSNIMRLMNRFFASSSKQSLKSKDVKKIMESLVPDTYTGRFNLALLDISRNICSYKTA